MWFREILCLSAAASAACSSRLQKRMERRKDFVGTLLGQEMARAGHDDIGHYVVREGARQRFMVGPDSQFARDGEHRNLKLTREKAPHLFGARVNLAIERGTGARDT